VRPPDRVEVVLLFDRRETLEKDGTVTVEYQVDGSEDYALAADRKALSVRFTFDLHEFERMGPDDLERVLRIQARSAVLTALKREERVRRLEDGDG
jgi:hypothetical protein